MEIPDRVIKAVYETQKVKNQISEGSPRSMMMADFGFSKLQIQKLAVRLNDIAGDFNSQTDIDAEKVAACKTVRDCIDLVISNSLTLFKK